MSAGGGPARRRIGLFGGTFDPIHLGHLRSAEEAREQLALERVLFVPAGAPPHKRGRRITAAAHRLAMVRLAIAGHPAFQVSTVEVQRRGRSYTIDTVRTLARQLPPDMRFALLVGLDAFRDIGTWKDFRALLGLVDVAVWTRPGARLAAPRALLPVAARGDFCYGPERTQLVHHTGTRIEFLTVTALDISASAIRQRLQRGQSVRYLVPAAVERYVTREGLYR
ncbi:MAG: nicotinate-nucleotide adenylyltransferase [Candidatus Binatia bacterium]